MRPDSTWVPKRDTPGVPGEVMQRWRDNGDDWKFPCPRKTLDTPSRGDALRQSRVSESRRAGPAQAT